MCCLRMGGGGSFRGFGAEGRETHIFLGLMAEQSETQILGVVELRKMKLTRCIGETKSRF